MSTFAGSGQRAAGSGQLRVAFAALLVMGCSEAALQAEVERVTQPVTGRRSAGPSFLRADAAAASPALRELIADFRHHYPTASAWFSDDRLEVLAVHPNDKLLSRSFPQTRTEHLGPQERRSLREIVPRPLEVSDCTGSDDDPEADDGIECGDEGVDYPSPFEHGASESQVRALLWDHFLGLVDDHAALFGTDRDFLRTHYEPAVVNRARFGFILTVRRSLGTIPVSGAPLRLLFGDDGQLVLLAGGLLNRNDLERAKALERQAVSEVETIQLAANRLMDLGAEAATGGEGSSKQDGTPQLINLERVYDPKRNRIADIVQMTWRGEDDDWAVRVDVVTGDAYTTYPLSLHNFNDASVRRATYPGGDLSTPNWVVTNNQYTRDSQRLEHDFFYLMSDRRCIGGSLMTCSTCASGVPKEEMCSLAPLHHCVGAHNAGSIGRVRGDIRAGRDFHVHQNSHTAEGYTYYWARQYMQWQKSALQNLGLLPGSSSNYTKALILVNACRASAYYTTNQFLKTEDNKGDGLDRIFLPNGALDYNNRTEYSSPASGTFAFSSAPVVAHELNHFVMNRYLGVDPVRDCGASEPNENILVHEGALGSVLPHAMWRTWYTSLTYAPTPLSRLYFGNETVGQVHTNALNLNRRAGDLHCNADGINLYATGRALGQALWKTHWGIDIHPSGSQQPIAAITNTNDFLLMLYASSLFASGYSMDMFAWLYTTFSSWNFLSHPLISLQTVRV